MPAGSNNLPLQIDFIMRKLLAILLLCYATFGFAQIKISNKPHTGNEFSIYSNGNASEIYIDNSDFEVVKIVSQLLAEDIERVSGQKREAAHYKIY